MLLIAARSEPYRIHISYSCHSAAISIDFWLFRKIIHPNLTFMPFDYSKWPKKLNNMQINFQKNPFTTI